MLPLVAIAAAVFGGGFLAKKLFDKPSAPSAHAQPQVVVQSQPQVAAVRGNPISAQRTDEFLELRSDGLYQFNRDTAVAVLGWMGSVQAVQAPSQWKNATIYDLVASSDGMPPPVGMGAGKILLSEARNGKTILVLRDITKVGVKSRRAAAVSGDMSALAGEGGDYAILIVPLQEFVEPKLPAMPGFEGAKRPIPGAVSLANKKTDDSGAELPPPQELPADLRVMVEDLLKRNDGDADALDAVARQLRLGGYGDNAVLIEQKAADIRAQDIVNAVELRTVFVIPKGHTGAMSLAKRMTGNPGRYKDLLAINPELKATKDGRVRPWVPGQIVKLPPTWGS